MSDAIEDRLAELERQVQLLRSGIHEIREIRLVDDSGLVQGTISAGSAGPMLAFNDDRGHVRAKLTVGPEGPGLTLADENGHTRAWLGFSKEALRIGFADETGNNRAFFGVIRKAGPVAKFYDQDQNLIWSAPDESKQ